MCDNVQAQIKLQTVEQHRAIDVLLHDQFLMAIAQPTHIKRGTDEKYTITLASSAAHKVHSANIRIESHGQKGQRSHAVRTLAWQ
jgi:hypothetical protein